MANSVKLECANQALNFAADHIIEIADLLVYQQHRRSFDDAIAAVKETEDPNVVMGVAMMLSASSFMTKEEKEDTLKHVARRLSWGLPDKGISEAYFSLVLNSSTIVAEAWLRPGRFTVKAEKKASDQQQPTILLSPSTAGNTSGVSVMSDLSQKKNRLDGGPTWLIAGPGARHHLIVERYLREGRKVCEFDAMLEAAADCDGRELRRHWRVGAPRNAEFMEKRASVLAAMLYEHDNNGAICVAYEPNELVPHDRQALDWLGEFDYLGTLEMEWSPSCLAAMCRWRREALSRRWPLLYTLFTLGGV